MTTPVLTLTAAAMPTPIVVSLPLDLQWTDEYDWLPIEQTEEYSLTGALIIDIGTRQAGRPITLAGDDETAWVSRATVDALRAWAATPGQGLNLTLPDTRTFSVTFRHSDDPALVATPVAFSAPMQAADQYIITLKLLEI
jgi:hypothetical protein